MISIVQDSQLIIVGLSTYHKAKSYSHYSGYNSFYLKA